ncbi:MAG: FlgD immunoglobulin-like domain containing protein [Candidatus Eiseniibacteriota bacterium]
MLKNDRTRVLGGRVPAWIGLGVFVFLIAGFGPSPAIASQIDLTIDGVPFDAARGEVENARMIPVEGSSVVLATWDERIDDGTFAPHYGVSLDGQELVRVKQTSYELGLRYGRFDPLAGTPEVDARLTEPADGRLFLVQLHTQPLEVFKAQIEALGGTVRQYVAQLAYLVDMDSSIRDAVEALPFVRWVGPYHVAYRLEEYMVEHLDQAEVYFPNQIYNIQVLAVDQKSVVAGRIGSIGGIVEKADAGKMLVRALLTPEQLLEVASWDEILFIDRWGPYEEDMNIAREIGGANHIETVAGYDGTGVRAEVFDAGFNTIHVDFQHHPLIAHGVIGSASHGASTSGINFGDGTGDPNARGMLPNAQGIVADYDYFGLTGPSRYAAAGELLLPEYEAIFQTSSVGSPRTTQYTTISADHDALLFDFDLTFCQSQSNSGWEDSRPQAWAKNIISGGGVRHYNTLTKTDDCWCNGASTGPASDGRIKPTLTHFYDNIRTTTCCGSTSYTSSFGGTSGATPIICGHVGLFFQMWSDGIFGNTVLPGGSVFANRSHMTTAKAMMVNTAEQYNFIGTGHDLNRMHQGWGMPDVGRMYDLRDQILVVNETDVLPPFATQTYEVQVDAGTPLFKVTMTYADPPGNPAVQSQHRINDLDLRVISPGGTVFYGNAGLLDSPYSVPGGSPDDKNTVENVFVLQPDAGTWTIEVETVELIEDNHLETDNLDADFALVASPVVRSAAGVDDSESGALPTELKMAILPLGPGIPEARMSFDLNAAAHVALDIFDVQGRTVASVYEGNLEAGRHTLAWDGVDLDGRDVAAGVYFVQLEAGDRVTSGKLLVVR